MVQRRQWKFLLEGKSWFNRPIELSKAVILHYTKNNQINDDLLLKFSKQYEKPLTRRKAKAATCLVIDDPADLFQIEPVMSLPAVVNFEKYQVEKSRARPDI